MVDATKNLILQYSSKVTNLALSLYFLQEKFEFLNMKNLNSGMGRGGNQ